MEILKTIGNNVKLKRKALKLSQQELADKAEVHRNYIGELERGRMNVSVNKLEDISKALNEKIINFFKTK